MTRSSRWSSLALLMAAASITALPFLSGNDFLLSRATGVVLFVLYALSLNLVAGMTGQLSIGHGAFALIGAYGSALLTAEAGWPIPLGVLTAMIAAGIVSLVVGAICLRLSGLYLAMMTVAVSLVLIRVTVQADDVTGGTDGLRGIPQFVASFELLPRVALWVIGTAMLLLVVVSWRIARSHVGLSYAAVRDNWLVAASSGIDVARARIVSFVLSGVGAGLGGALFAHWQGFISPDQFGVFFSLELLLMVFLGGAGTVMGPVVGAIVLASFPFFVPRDLQAAVPFVHGLLLVVFAVLLPAGIVGLLKRGVTRTFGRWSRSGSERFESALAEARGSGDGGGSKIVGDGSRHGGARQEEPDEEERNVEALLRVTELSKTFGGLKAVSGVSFEVDRGTIHCLIGPNGSGKSTTINLISGVLEPDSGTVRLGRERIDGCPAHVVARHGVARTFQTGRVLPKLSVVDNVLLGGHRLYEAGLLSVLAGSRSVRREWDALRRQAHEILAWVGLEEVSGMPAGALSAGHARLLEIARAVMSRPRVLLLDEPAAGLSETESVTLQERLMELRTNGIAVFLIEHHLSLVMSVADRITVLDRGKVIADGIPSEVRKSSAVRKAYLGE